MRIRDMGYPIFLAVLVVLCLVGCWGILRTVVVGMSERHEQHAERVYTQDEHQWLSTCVSMGESLWICQHKLNKLNSLKVEPTP